MPCVSHASYAQISYTSGPENESVEDVVGEPVPIYKNAEALEIIEQGFIVSVSDMLVPTPNLYTKNYTIIWHCSPYDCQIVYNMAGIYADCIMLTYIP